MAGGGWRSRKLWVGLVAVAALGGGAAWVERAPLLAWYYLRQLAAATDDTREAWVDRVVGLGDMAPSGLLDVLARRDARACGNARAALERLAADWGPADPRTTELARALARVFGRLSPPGQQHGLALAGTWVTSAPDATALLPTAARLLESAAAASDADVQAAALDLCSCLLRLREHAEVIRPAQELVQSALHSGSADNRLKAVRLALEEPGMDLLEQVVGLLSDPEVEVRRAALLAVGPAQARDLVPDECLLVSLHDPDPEVRRLCEVALGGRGLSRDYIELGRLLTHPQPSMRLQVLDQLYRSPDLDESVWLRRLSHDPSPAVRVAAMRAMTLQPYLDLSDRIDQMARSDQSPTVCQLARYYLRCPRPARPAATQPPPAK
jgi:hypothetical protein